MLQSRDNDFANAFTLNQGLPYQQELLLFTRLLAYACMFSLRAIRASVVKVLNFPVNDFANAFIWNQASPYQQDLLFISGLLAYGTKNVL